MDTAATDFRAQRGLAIVQGKGTKIRQVIEGKYLVPSQTRTAGSYFVDVAEAKCSCPDHEETGKRCKHLWAVLIVRREVTLPDGTSVVSEKRITYTQNWPAYRKSRVYEKELFERLLRSLCDGVAQPKYKGNGRPALPLSDVIFAGGLKVYSLFAGDRVQSDIRSCKERGLTDVVPHPNTVFRIMRSPSTVPVLRNLIEQSTMPLRNIETDFAADGTGIGTTVFGPRWHDTKWGKDRREKKWLKLHMMVGVKTQIITAAEVTPGNMHDSPFLPALIETTAKTFNMREVSADLGYSGRANLHAIVNAGATPYVPFKSNSSGGGKDPLWSNLHAYYTLNRPEFLEHYHKRSLSETTFSTVKRVLGATVKATSDHGQVSEVYVKVLCHNIRMLVQSIFELNVDPKFWMPPSEGEAAE